MPLVNSAICFFNVLLKLFPHDYICCCCSLYLNELKIKHAKFFSNPLTGLNLQLSEVNVSMRANVSPPWQDKTVVITASLSDILLAAKVKKDSEGQPVFNITHCSINFSSNPNIDIGFHL